MAKNFDDLDDNGWKEFQNGIDGRPADNDDPLEAYEKEERKDLDQAAETWKAAERTANAQKEAERLRLQNTKAVAEANRESSQRLITHLSEASEVGKKDAEYWIAASKAKDKLFMLGAGCFVAGIGLGYLLGRRRT
jgi:hypothetical protein